MKRGKTGFQAFKAKVSKKREGKDEAIGKMEYLTVQRLSSHVEGRYQKYARIGALTMVPLGSEPTVENIKAACKKHFKAENMDCDILAGERGPSWTETSQISSWKTIHIRFVERDRREETRASHISIPDSVIKGASLSLPQAHASKSTTTVAASVPLSAMLQLGKLIQPKFDVVSVQLEEFDIAAKSWRQPVEAKLSVAKEKFAEGSFREAYLSSAISQLKPGKYVLKRFKKEKTDDIEKMFGNMEAHTRKVVQMNALARHLALRLSKEAPEEFGPALEYTKVYFGKLYDESVTVEPYMDGTFVKYINNTGQLCGRPSELREIAETFSHFTYINSGRQLMVLDIQGIGHTLCDPEIATTELMDESGSSILFCCGNLSSDAIGKFKEAHACNKFCEALQLQKM